MAKVSPLPNLANLPHAPSPDDTDPGRPRYAGGWRNGKPMEDPEKTKSWGWVTAKPSEYLIHVRRGKVLRGSSGQGAACFKRPWDSVAVIPTTIARLTFKADQITREKVGVEVTGLAVYRIVEPELTYKMLNFSFGERAGEKLESTLREMFMGSARRLVASMGVEEVLTRRKEGLAAELMREIAPVVSGSGASADRTDRGWGVVLDTIEIQDVRILSDVVFANMQALFRNELALRAREAELSASQAIAEQETASRRQIEEARITAESATRELKAKAESKAAEIELAEAMKREKLKAAVERSKIEEQRAVEEARLSAASAAADLSAQLSRRAAEARIALESAETAGRIEREEALLAARAFAREREIGLFQKDGDAKNQVALGARSVENTVTEEALRRDLVLKTMPAIATAFSQNFGEMKFVNFGGGAGSEADPVAFVARAFAQVMEVARSAGLDLGKIGGPTGGPAASAPPKGL